MFVVLFVVINIDVIVSAILVFVRFLNRAGQQPAILAKTIQVMYGQQVPAAFAGQNGSDVIGSSTAAAVVGGTYPAFAL